jgi:hypothetical protein
MLKREAEPRGSAILSNWASQERKRLEDASPGFSPVAHAPGSLDFCEPQSLAAVRSQAEPGTERERKAEPRGGGVPRRG